MWQKNVSNTLCPLSPNHHGNHILPSYTWGRRLAEMNQGCPGGWDQDPNPALPNARASMLIHAMLLYLCIIGLHCYGNWYL